jgi:class 3 adenylate cyclase
MPEVHYAPADEADIAYTITGEGEIPLIWTLGYVSHLDVNWAFPLFRRFCEALGEFCRLIVYDKRGMGLSSRGTPGTPLETRMDDIRAVLDHAGIERAAVMGESEGGPLSMLFAAAHPERVTHLVLQGAEVRERSDDEWPWGDGDDEWFEEYVAGFTDHWGTASEGWAIGLFGKELDDPAWATEHLSRLLRNAASPREALAWQLASREIDVRSVLPSIRVPTLVLHCIADRVVPIESGRYIAEHIPGGRLVERSGTEHLAWMKPEAVVPDIREFLTGERMEPEAERVLATVLFTDLVGSTDRAARMGDAAWRGLLETHHAAARREIAAHRGIEVGSAGDGFLARFDGPGRAIRCAEAIIDEASRHGLEVRAGVHTGEVELVGDDIAGLAVHIGARIAGMAGAGEILVSGSVRDISAGSGVSFVDRGEHELRGVPGSWRVYAVDR